MPCNCREGCQVLGIELGFLAEEGLQVRAVTTGWHPKFQFAAESATTLYPIGGGSPGLRNYCSELAGCAGATDNWNTFALRAVYMERLVPRNAPVVEFVFKKRVEAHVLSENDLELGIQQLKAFHTGLINAVE